MIQNIQVVNIFQKHCIDEYIFDIFLEYILELFNFGTCINTCNPLGPFKEIQGQSLTQSSIQYSHFILYFFLLHLYLHALMCHDDTHILSRKELNPQPCYTHVKSLTIVITSLCVLFLECIISYHKDIRNYFIFQNVLEYSRVFYMLEPSRIFYKPSRLLDYPRTFQSVLDYSIENYK